ncbi:MAG TPA: hypothetical protein PL182_11930, partial [Pseudobdellovibrionaceae bacterium]|nr:hypothetical protein [Pseudobdellovibrionaceae bacterium]
GQDITIKGHLTSGTSFPIVGEQCWPHVKAKGSIAKSTHGGKDVYTFGISSPIGYANESDTFGFDCGSSSACVKIDTRVVPKSKIIYSSNLDLIYRNDSVTGYNVVNGVGQTEVVGDVKVTANFSPVINVSGGQLILTGTYHSNVHIVSGAGQYSMANGKTINCKYAMTISQ